MTHQYAIPHTDFSALSGNSLKTGLLFFIFSAFCSSISVFGAQLGSSDWPSQNLNLHNSRYSPLDQIDTNNVSGLALRWSFEAGPRDDIS